MNNLSNDEICWALEKGSRIYMLCKANICRSFHSITGNWKLVGFVKPARWCINKKYMWTAMMNEKKYHTKTSGNTLNAVTLLLLCIFINNTKYSHKQG